MNDTTLIEALDKLGEELSTKIDGLASRNRQEEIQTTVNQIDGYVRDHDKVLAGHQQWIESHGEAHAVRDRDFRTLSNRVWASLIGGGSGLLVAAIRVLEALKL